MTIDILIYKDHVVICGNLVRRPNGVSASQWLEFWDKAEEAKNYEAIYQEGYDAGLQDGREE